MTNWMTLIQNTVVSFHKPQLIVHAKPIPSVMLRVPCHISGSVLRELWTTLMTITQNKPENNERLFDMLKSFPPSVESKLVHTDI